MGENNPQNCLFPWGIRPLPNKWFIGPTRVYNPSSILIWPAVSVQHLASRFSTADCILSLYFTLGCSQKLSLPLGDWGPNLMHVGEPVCCIFRNSSIRHYHTRQINYDIWNTRVVSNIRGDESRTDISSPKRNVVICVCKSDHSTTIFFWHRKQIFQNILCLKPHKTVNVKLCHHQARVIISQCHILIKKLHFMEQMLSEN